VSDKPENKQPKKTFVESIKGALTPDLSLHNALDSPYERIMKYPGQMMAKVARVTVEAEQPDVQIAESFKNVDLHGKRPGSYKELVEQTKGSGFNLDKN
jgi:hypothetical protein